MARAFYFHEIDDPDLEWLISNFIQEHPEYTAIETPLHPIVLVKEDYGYEEFTSETEITKDSLPPK